MLVKTLAALAEPTRLAVIAMLAREDELCVCEIMARLDVSQSRASRHMQVLKAAGLVRDRRDRQWVRYRLNPDMPPAIAAILKATVAAYARENPNTDKRNAA